MRSADLYAYSLRSLETGWSWHVYDEEGTVVASGVAHSQNDATVAVTRVIARPGEFVDPAKGYRAAS